mmetsp:Transcript_1309/g.1658  ORF Transcript_1309/g.1658 Transcript_1309/m.1658 type:complete len:207 (-) Transcript_1309:199-819(-)
MSVLPALLPNLPRTLCAASLAMLSTFCIASARRAVIRVSASDSFLSTSASTLAVCVAISLSILPRALSAVSRALAWALAIETSTAFCASMASSFKWAASSRSLAIELSRRSSVLPMLGRMKRDRTKYRNPNSTANQNNWEGKCHGSNGGKAAFSAPCAASCAASAASKSASIAFQVPKGLEKQSECGLDHKQNEDRDQEGQNAKRF